VKRLAFVAALAAGAISYVNAATLPVSVKSPDGSVVVQIAQNDAGQLTYSVVRKNAAVISPSAFRVNLKEGDISAVDVVDVASRVVDQKRKLVATKAA